MVAAFLSLYSIGSIEIVTCMLTGELKGIVFDDCLVNSYSMCMASFTVGYLLYFCLYSYILSCHLCE